MEQKYYDLTLPIRLKFNVGLKKKLKKIRFEIHIVEHCNLNCKSCSHFSPLAEKEFIPREEFESEIKRMGEIFNHECDRITLMGGEPLLHTEINTFMKIARENFTNGFIYITTNGTLLTRMDDEFWKTCHDYDIYIQISHYPIDIKAEKIKELAKKFDVQCFWNMYDFRDEFRVCAMDLDGKQDYRKNFAVCGPKTDCNDLSHGKLYSCCFPAHVELFNKKFNTDIKITLKDYIDIYSDITKEEIFKRLTEPFPACRYCNLPARRNTEWGISKQDINEWL